jgi:hypothetical protein
MSAKLDDEITHELKADQVYRDARTDELMQLVYIDCNISVLQDEKNGSHRLNKRSAFEDNVRSGRYSYEPDEDAFADTSEGIEGADELIPFEELDSIGEKGAQNLRDAGYETRSDVVNASDEELLDVSWVGESGVQSIREEVQ